MKNKLLELVDFEKINVLLEGYNQSTGFVTAILDLEGHVLSKSGWRPICNEFHRVNPHSAKKCLVSDTELANKMGQGEKYHSYKCLNGMVDVAFPIVINGEHIANLFAGQFFFEKPDVDFFKNQAKKYGFNEQAYLESLAKVPVVAEEKVKVAMDFLLKMTELIVEMSVQKLELIELNKTLKESEDNFRSLYNNSLDMYASVSPLDASILQCNETLLTNLGYSREELIGAPIFKLYQAECMDDVQKSFQQFVETGKVTALELILKRKDGSSMDVSLNVNSIRDKTGKIIHSISSWRDIGERKRIERELHQRNEYIESILENIPIGSALTTMKDWDVKYLNKRFEEIYGWDKEILTNNDLFFEKVFPEPEYRKKILDQVMKDMKTGDAEKMNWKDLKITTSSGEIRYVHAFNIPLPEQNILISTVQDITPWKLAEEALKDNEARLKLALEINNTGAWDLNFSEETSNRTLLHDQIFGYETALPHWNFEDFLKHVIPEDRKIVKTLFEEARKTKTDWKFECRIQRPDGEKRWISAIGRHILNPEGEPSILSGVVQDITERKKVEEEIKRLNRELENRVQERTEELQNSQDALLNMVEDLNEKAEELKNSSKSLQSANKELESFSYSISHDLRAPLRAIFGFSQILASRHRESLNEEGKNYMDYVVNASIRMEQLINDLLNYSRLGKKSLLIRPVSLDEVIKAVLADHAEELEIAGGKLKLMNELPTIMGDETLFRQIFSNLVGNAIKYRRIDTPVEITISSQPVSDGYLVKVTDNGIGIDEKYWEKIFHVFQRLHSENVYPGTGIGLANVKKAVTLLGGNIDVESKVGSGTTFSIIFSALKL